MQQQISGYVERITFHNEENGYSVLQLKLPGFKDCVCIVGSFPGIQTGETLNCEGEWKQHPTYGRQFEVKSHRVKAPSDLVGIQKYLGSGLIKGIGPVYANRIVDQFGIETLTVIDQQPEKLGEVRGLGKKRIGQIQSCWAGQKVIREVMIFLQGHGVSPAYAQKIFKIYGTECIKRVSENPYQLARDVFGIGFKMADQIASNLGIVKDAPERIDAGIEFALRELAEEGHVCYPQEEFIPAASELLAVEKVFLPPRIAALEKAERIVIFPLIVEGKPQPFLWFKPYFHAETGIANELDRIKHAPCHLRPIDIARAVSWVQQALGLELAPAQAEAVGRSLIGKLLIITGGPGTGKSTITKAILKITEKLTDRILLAAPTGRAAKRMSEITGRKASTIHSLLEVDFKTGGFKRKKDNPLECDLLIVDEASMIDTHLMHNLLKAIPSTARVLFVGDVNQLPSVGPGTVLLDMIRSLQIPVVTLNEIFRQAQGSKIIVNAHRINQGQFPEIRNQADSDFFFIEAETPDDVLNHIVKLVAQRLPARYGFHAIQDIQVLSPMKRGIVGIENLNTVLQDQLNPQVDSLFKAGRKFHVGDKVMQIRNNYKKMVFNGDVGRIRAFDLEEAQVVVQFDEEEVIYEFSELDELVLAYAVSIHKYQGSECPCVVMPVHTTHFKLLHRNLLYTGVTRGKKLVVIVGSKQALALAVKNDEVKQRYTGLKQALLGIIK
jgi:exodeoxyribonuclease V alpha subunit